MKPFPLFTTALLLLLAAICSHGSGVWSTDLTKAQAQARAEGKAVLVNFTGSDWCGWCMKLRKDVFLKPAFTNYAQTNLVLVEVDFPKRKPLTPAAQKANQQLAQQFQVQGFPTLVLIDSTGNRIGNVNYANGGPKSFINEVEKLLRPPSETPQPKPAAKKPVAPKRVTPATASATTNRADLVLSRIVRTKKSRQAVINNTTLAAGQSATIKVGNERVKILVVEVRERSAIISIEGQREKRELRLANGT